MIHNLNHILQNDKAHRLILLIVAVIVLIMGILAIAVPPACDYDSCWGFLVMHSMEQGHPFNLLITPADDNIAKNQTEFLTWWTPGQYIIPYFFKTILKINTAQAASITVIIGDLIGLAGFYKLFTKMGFSKWIAAVSMAFIITQQVFVQQFVYYRGSEVVLFAFMGWFLYGCFSVKKITWQVLVLVLLAGPIGFFAKSSFLWIYAAGIACLWINVSIDQSQEVAGTPLQARDYQRLRVWLLNGVLLAVSFISSVAIIYFCFLSKGPNPTTETGQIVVRAETFGFPLASPLIAGFSIDELTGGLVYQPDNTFFPYQWGIIILLVLSVGSIVLVARAIKFAPDKKYAIAMVVFYVLGVVFFSWMFLEQANISYEGRHFRILGLLATPGLIYLFFKTKTSKAIFFIIWISLLACEFGYFMSRYKVNIQAAKNISGFSQPRFDQATLAEITKLDASLPANAIFVVMRPEMAMEIKNKRWIIIDEGNMAEKDFLSLKYPGKAGPLYIIIPAVYLKDGKREMIIKSFTSYHQFAIKKLSSKYYLCTATN